MRSRCDGVGLPPLLSDGVAYRVRQSIVPQMYNLSGDNGISRDELVTMFNSIRGDTVPVRGRSSRSLCCARQPLNQVPSRFRAAHAVQDPELPEQLADMDKAALDELARRTLDELADLDQRIAGSLVNPESIYTLLEQKAAKELLLSRIGLGTAAAASPVADARAARGTGCSCPGTAVGGMGPRADALEAYRATHETLQDTLQTMAEEALRTCGRVRSGKLNFAQFCVWLKANPLAVDRWRPLTNRPNVSHEGGAKSWAAMFLRWVPPVAASSRARRSWSSSTASSRHRRCAAWSAPPPSTRTPCLAT